MAKKNTNEFSELCNQMCQLALLNGTETPIDYDLLRTSR